jgi:aquaporin Z
MGGDGMTRYGAEFFGTFWLVLGGCGSAVLAAAFPELGIGLLGVSLAFGLTVLTMAYAIGHISGCHLNPAVSVGLWAGGRFPSGQLVPYIVAQVLGAVFAGGVLFLIASGKAGFDVSAGFASNGYGAHSPGGYSMLAALVTEVVMTAMFLVIILGATDKRAPQGFAPLAIGLGLTLIHLISIPVGESGAQHRSRPVRGRLGRRAAVALLAGSCRRRPPGREPLPAHWDHGDGRRARGRGRSRRSPPAEDARLILYLVLTFALTWSLWFASGIFSPAGPDFPLFLLGVFMPGIVAVAMTARAGGRPGTFSPSATSQPSSWPSP